MNINDFKIPAIAAGQILPHEMEYEKMKQEKEEFLRKQQRRHDWKIAMFGVIGGGVMGFISSLLFWLITT